MHNQEYITIPSNSRPNTWIIAVECNDSTFVIKFMDRDLDLDLHQNLINCHC